MKIATSSCTVPTSLNSRDIHSLSANDSCLDASTGLLHAVVSRSNKNHYTFGLSCGTDKTATTVLLSAKRGNFLSKTQYILFDKTTDCRIGCLEQIRSDLVAHAYRLMLDNQEGTASVIAYIVYRVPPVSVLIPGSTAPTRYMEVVVPSHSLMHDDYSKKDDVLEACMKDATKGVQVNNWKVKTSHDTLLTMLCSLEPYVTKNGQTGFNFKGRGRMPSSKNTQLICYHHAGDTTINKHGSNNTGKGSKSGEKQELVCFQMAKWDNNLFNVDFKAPVSPFLAFGMALAQLDI